MNCLEKLLCSLGGADIDILQKCPGSEKKKFLFASIGIINTAVLSAATMGVAIHLVDKKIFVLAFIICALIWGWFVFVIDSGLLASLCKKAKGAYNRLTTALLIFLRIAISVIIALSVSQPLESIIFKKFIPMAQRKQEVIYLNKLNGPKLIEEEAVKKRLDEADEEFKKWNLEKEKRYTSDFVLSNMIRDKETMEKQYSGLSGQYADLNKQSWEIIAVQQKTMNAIQDDIDIINSRNYLTENDKEQIFLWTDQKAAAGSIVNNENNAIQKRNNELYALNQKVLNKQAEIMARKTEIDADNAKITQNLQDKKDRVNSEYEITSSEAQDYYDRNNKAASSFQDDNLVNNLNAIHYIESWAKNPDATTEEKNIGKLVKKTRILIILLFLVIDTAPIFIKLSFARGIYEEEKDTQEAVIIHHNRNYAFKQKEAEAKFAENKMQAEFVMSEIEDTQKRFERFLQIQEEMQKNTSDILYNKDRAKFQGKHQGEMPDSTQNVIRETFRNTQKLITAMFQKLHEGHNTSNKQANEDFYKFG
jgi:hypothetical protein